MIATHTYTANIQYLYCQLLSVTVTAACDGPVAEQVAIVRSLVRCRLSIIIYQITCSQCLRLVLLGSVRGFLCTYMFSLG